MPVTDLQIVAQYAKSSRTAPAHVHNAACRLLDQQASRDLNDKREGCNDPHCHRTECLHLGTCWEDAFWAEGPNGKTTKNGAESHENGLTLQTQGASEGHASTEAQEGSQ